MWIFAMAVDVQGHLRVPEARLVPEVDSGFNISRMLTVMDVQ